MNRKQDSGQLLKQLPTKWALAIVAVLVVYALAQPVINRGMGWKLPSLAALLGQEEQPRPDAEMASRKEASQTKSSSEVSTDEDVGLSATSVDPLGNNGGNELQRKMETGSNANSETRVAQPRGPPQASSAAEDTVATSDATAASRASQKPGLANSKLKYGLLTEIGKEDYMSAGGLRYTPGSTEGHRLKHLERHLKDQPDRPSSHGVFYGDMPQVIRWLDDAYARAKAGERGTSRENQGKRTVYEASFEKPVGFVGGRTGARKGNPDARRIRLVVEGNRVITAFPF